LEIRIQINKLNESLILFCANDFQYVFGNGKDKVML